MWVYWKEQCDYCIYRDICKYESSMRQYIKDLDDVQSKTPVYGSLSYKCDYYQLDEKTYSLYNSEQSPN